MLHTHKRPKGLTKDDIVKIVEDVFVQGETKPSFAGKRISVVRIVGNGIPGRVIVQVVKSRGVNAFPENARIQRPLSNVLNGHDLTGSNEDYFKSGGSVNNGSTGGYAQGPKHTDGGMPGVIKPTGKPIEFEGGEVIITAPAVEDNDKREFEGQMLTNRQILSKINESGGGVSFADGGSVSSCKCSGKAYKYGGETLTDYEIVNRMNTK
jgi:hypothetical protein